MAHVTSEPMVISFVQKGVTNPVQALAKALSAEGLARGASESAHYHLNRSTKVLKAAEIAYLGTVGKAASWNDDTLRDAYRAALVQYRHYDNLAKSTDAEFAQASKIVMGLTTVTKKDYSVAERKAMAAKGQAMSDGSYPIANAADLEHAVTAFNMNGHGDPKIKAWIVASAKRVGATDKLPSTWDVSKSVEKATTATLADNQVLCPSCFGAAGFNGCGTCYGTVFVPETTLDGISKGSGFTTNELLPSSNYPVAKAGDLHNNIE